MQACTKLEIPVNTENQQLDTGDLITWLQRALCSNSSYQLYLPSSSTTWIRATDNSQAIISTSLNRGKQHSTIPEELCTKELLITCSKGTAKKFKKLPVSAALVKYSIGPGVNILSFLAAHFDLELIQYDAANAFVPAKVYEKEFHKIATWKSKIMHDIGT